jgi:YMGG-like Gly-zipper
LAGTYFALELDLSTKLGVRVTHDERAVRASAIWQIGGSRRATCQAGFVGKKRRRGFESFRGLLHLLFSSLTDGGKAQEDGGIKYMKTIQKWATTTALRAFAVIVGLSLLVMVLTACGTMTGAAVGAGSGAAIGAAAGDAKKGALIGAGVGAAGGAIYDATR